MKLSSSNIKKFLIFSYISENGNPSQNSVYFRKQNFLIFQDLKKTYISESNFLSLKSKKRALLKRFLYFRRNFQSPKNKQKICSEEISCLL